MGIICLVICWGFVEPSSDFLKKRVNRLSIEIEVNRQLNGYTINQLNGSKQLSNSAINQLTQRTSVLNIARSQLGIREATGKNDGAAVEAYLNYTANRKGEPWCASFISWVYGKAGFSQPKTAWSPALFPVAKQTINPLPADVFGIYYFKLRRIAHCGLIEAVKGNWVKTIEGNTNAESAREGNGVYRKLRHKLTIAVYANWLNHLKKGERE